jgi:hypothetical protein
MLCLDSLTGIAKGNIFFNISLHLVPLVGCLEVFVHLIPSWMNGIRGIVSLSKYLILQFFNVMHMNPSFVPQPTLVILHKSG